MYHIFLYFFVKHFHKDICLIMDSATVNPMQASFSIVEMNVHTINPSARKGKNSFMEVPKRLPKIIPNALINTPMLMVSQKGPRDDRLYR